MSMIFNPVQTTPYSVSYKIKSRLWNVINSTLFRWTPFFMRRTRVALLKLFGANIKWNCSISGKASIVDPWNLTVGEFSSIDEACCVRCRDKVVIGEKTCISRGVDILTGSHNIYSPHFEMVTSPITIGNNVWIATKATVGRGVTIGDGAVIGAQATVFKDVEPWTVVGGNPATPIKKRIIKDIVKPGLGGAIFSLKFKVRSLKSGCAFCSERRVAA